MSSIIPVNPAAGANPAGAFHPEVAIHQDVANMEGVTAHMFQLVVVGDMARLDAVYVDQAPLVNGENRTVGKVVSRVNMTTGKLNELYLLLKEHYEKHQQQN